MRECSVGNPRVESGGHVVGPQSFNPSYPAVLENPGDIPLVHMNNTVHSLISSRGPYHLATV